MDPDTPKELARATAETAKLGTKSLKFLERITGAPLEQLSGLVADEIAFIRATRRLTMQKVLDRAQAELESRDGRAERVPLKTLAPLLTESSLEEDDELIDRWASLLANAADPDAQRKVEAYFVRLMASLTPQEARALQVNYDSRGHEPQVGQKLVFPPTLGLSEDQVELIKEHLTALGIATRHLSSQASWDGPSAVVPTSDVYLSRTGLEFLRACHPPTGASEGAQRGERARG